ncbi:hypothetical protein [Nocardia arthritidis]|uniref:DUF1573 domain-containing protein n=1 Tax=Nocardia arthritidis TaxID=228602 RepID=A0A6G9Y9X8_9NOCA|nr:hypothetical protein [Nocardia arthritidis]QIS10075.1 hypothetical protein F5544_10900 [Nocardia arthritidis]
MRREKTNRRLAGVAIAVAAVGFSLVTSASASAETGSADGIDVTISPQDPTTLRPGGAPMRFTVTLANTTATDNPAVGLVVSLGHCSCSPSPVKMMPAGSMLMLDPATNIWQAVPYVVEGGGTDFLGRTVVAPFALEHGQTATYQLEVRLAADQEPAIGSGASSVDVTVTDPATNTALGHSPTTSLPITVEP